MARPACPRCGSPLRPDAPACESCGMPAALDGPDEGVVLAGGEGAIEPEVLGSLDEAERTRAASRPRQIGCTLGPGCGCVGLPLAALAGAALSALLALLWILSLGRVPASLARLARGVRRGGRGSG